MAAEKENAVSVEELVTPSKQKPVRAMNMMRGGESAEELEGKIDWEAVSEYELENENGSTILFSDVYGDYTTIVIFIRHFLCFTAKDYVEDLALIPQQTLEEKKVRLAIIGCGKSKFMKQFRRDTGYWAEFYSDPERELYKLMNLKTESTTGNADKSMHIKTNAFMGVLQSAWRSSTFPGEWQGDQQQLGGAFILGPGDVCHFAHVDQNPADHYPINKLLDLVGVPNVSFLKDSGVHNV